MKNLKLLLVISVISVGVVAQLKQHSEGSVELNRLQKKLARQSSKLKELHKVMGPVEAGDWLASHDEAGQTFKQYLDSSPVRISSKRKTLYVLPLGDFDENQKRIVDLSAEFLGLFYCCNVTTLESVGLDEAIPVAARRVHPTWGVRQINSRHVLNEVLPKRLPRDAVALIALTTSDLYPDENWNFVFGQASLRNRVGVWSLFRNGDPQIEFLRCLERTLKTASHETGHMFSIRHCTAYECNMCGSNSQQESDRRPIYLCPECLPKVWWATKCDPISRFKRLQSFCETNKLDAYAMHYEKCIQTLEKSK